MACELLNWKMFYSQIYDKYLARGKKSERNFVKLYYFVIHRKIVLHVCAGGT